MVYIGDLRKGFIEKCIIDTIYNIESLEELIKSCKASKLYNKVSQYETQKKACEKYLDTLCLEMNDLAED